MTRPYQRDAIKATLTSIEKGNEKGLWVLPTGTGKTVTACELIRCLHLPTLFLAHREELLSQTQRTLQRMFPKASTGIVKGATQQWNSDIVIASVQSLHSKRREQINPDRFGLIVVDEAHHSKARTWEELVGYFQSGFTIGMTATPDRLDGKGLGDLFGSEPLYSMSLLEAIRGKWLVDIRQFAVETDVDLNNVETRLGDFVGNQLAEAVDTHQRNQIIVEAYRTHAEGRRAITFCVTVEHAYSLSNAFTEAGVRSDVVHGNLKSDDRERILDAFQDGGLQVVCNVNVLSEGFDDPGIACVIMARPTKSRAYYQQAVGRGLRLHPGKKDCLILDITDNCRRHKLVVATSLLGVKKPNLEGGFLSEALTEQEEEEAWHQEQLRLPERRIRWRLESVCPWPELPTLDGWQDYLPWHFKPASEKQLKTLQRMGVAIGGDAVSCGQASWLLDQAFQYEEAFPSPATAKQEWYLRYIGKWVEGMTKREAGKLIGELKKQDTTTMEAAT